MHPAKRKAVIVTRSLADFARLMSFVSPSARLYFRVRVRVISS
jgi:hypothetical protein